MKVERVYLMIWVLIVLFCLVGCGAENLPEATATVMSEPVVELPPTETAAPSATNNASPTAPPTETATSEPSATVTETATPTESPTATATDEPTATATETLPPSPTVPSATPTITLTPAPRAPFSAQLAYTYQQPDGNRYALGRGVVPYVEPLDVPLSGIPLWVVGAPQPEGGSLWVVGLANGETQSFVVQNGQVSEQVAAFPPLRGAPPLLRFDTLPPTLIMIPETENPSLVTHAHPLRGDNRFAFIDRQNQVKIWENGGITPLAINALPDARLLFQDERLLFLSEPTARYPHGVLGDNFEAGSIILLATEPYPQVLLSISIPEAAVIEGIMPIWKDLNGDGQREILVTESDITQGSRLVLFNEAGERLAEGPALSEAYRWQHQIAVGPLGPFGETEIVSVVTPHLGGIVEYYRWEGNSLNVVAQIPGYSSHVISSRNLDMSAIGDFDNDGNTELLIPTWDRVELIGIRRITDNAVNTPHNGALVVWNVPMVKRLSSNIATITQPDGSMSVGAGDEEGILRLWLP